LPNAWSTPRPSRRPTASVSRPARAIVRAHPPKLLCARRAGLRKQCASHLSAPHPPPTKGPAPLSRRGHRVSELSGANVGSSKTTSVPCAEATLAVRSAHRSQGGARPSLKSYDALRKERAQALPLNEAFARASFISDSVFYSARISRMRSNGEVEGPADHVGHAPRAHNLSRGPRRPTTSASRTPPTIVRWPFATMSILTYTDPDDSQGQAARVAAWRGQNSAVLPRGET
jgi:hypothetical protein